MEIKDKDNLQKTAKADKNNRQTELLKSKVNDFLMDYFNYLLIGLVLIIFVIGLFVIIYPKYQQIVQAKDEATKNLQAEYEVKLNYLNSIRNLQESYRLISADDREKINKMVPAINDPSAIITEIGSIAEKNSAILNSIKIDTQSNSDEPTTRSSSGENKDLPAGIFTQPPKGVNSVKITAALSSTNYPTLKNVIKTLENNLRLFDIVEINFNPDKNSATLGFYSYNLKVNN